MEASRMSKAKTANDWLSDIIEAEQIKSNGDVIPPGWYSIDCIATKTGITMYAANSRAARWVRSGKAQRRQFRVNIAGCLRMVWHYNKK